MWSIVFLFFAGVGGGPINGANGNWPDDADALPAK